MQAWLTTAPYRLRLAIRHFAANRVQTALMVSGVALGVAVVVAIDLANTSAERAFVLSTEAIAGRATHRISGGEIGVPVSVYRALRWRGVRTSAPVIERTVVVAGRPMTLLGVDPFADAAFRGYGARSGEGLDRLLTEPATTMLAANTAESLGLAEGDEVPVLVGGAARSLTIAGLFSSDDARKQRASSVIALVDIATAQELVGRPQRVDRVDLILAAEEEESVAALLPAGLTLEAVGTAAGPARAMIAAFQTNLRALSLLALIVGLFLIFNTMNFSVIRRRASLGTLRALGMTSREVFVQICSEAALIGAAGTVIGLAFGTFLGRAAIDLVTQTINDLFFPLTFREASVSPFSLIQGALLGLVATVLAALPGASEAASAPPRRAFLRSGLEDTASRLVVRAALIGCVLIAVGGASLALPGGNLLLGFGGLFGVTLGAAFLAPLATRSIMQWAARPAAALGGSMLAAAPRDVARSLSRTSTAIAALMLAISVAIGLRLMIGSFRTTVALWLENTLTGDVYISAPSLGGTASTAVLDPGVVKALADRPDTTRLALVRSGTLRSDRGPVRIAATTEAGTQRAELLQRVAGSRSDLASRLDRGDVMISEPLASRLQLDVGATLRLAGRDGWVETTVAAIYHDYASSQGIVMLDLAYYRALSGENGVTGAALSLRDPEQADRVAREVATELATVQVLDARANRSLREEVFAVFDQAFRITSALVLLATVVAALGVLSALLAVQLERRRDYGILRAIGLTAKQAGQQIYLQTALLGGTAAVLAIPTGTAVAYLLVHVINRRAFGWTLQLSFSAEPFLGALTLGAVAALVAAIVPVRRIRAAEPVELLR